MNPDLAPNALRKPERRAAVKRRAARTRRLTRRQCCELVYRRERMRCQRCGQKVRRPSECYPLDADMAHVNEPGGRHNDDELKPEACELVCGACHFVHGAHAPTPARMRRLLALSARAKRMKREARG